jgi:hypothetical protein
MTKIIKFLRPLGLSVLTVAAGSFVLKSAPAQSVELVTNGNFQTVANPATPGFPGVANSTGWTTTGTTSIIPVSTLTAGANPLIVSETAGFGYVATVGTVPASVPFPGFYAPTTTGTWSYNLVTNPGSTYRLSYNFADYAYITDILSLVGGRRSSFEVTRNDSPIAGTSLQGNAVGAPLFPPNIAPTVYTGLRTSRDPTTTTFVGTGNDRLSFVFRDVIAAGIDNVSVTEDAPRSVPEPFTIVGTLIGSAAALRMRKKYRATNKM